MATDADTHPEESFDYPPNAMATAKEVSRHYRDEAAASLYRAADGKDLVKAHAKLTRALVAQADKLETHFNTPFSRKQAGTIRITIEAIERAGNELERWHHLMYPNQRPDAAA